MDVRGHYHSAGWPQVSAVWAVCNWLKVGGKKPRMWKLLPPVASPQLCCWLASHYSHASLAWPSSAAVVS